MKNPQREAAPAVSDAWLGRISTRLADLRELRNCRMRREDVARELAGLEARQSELESRIAGQVQLEFDHVGTLAAIAHDRAPRSLLDACLPDCEHCEELERTLHTGRYARGFARPGFLAALCLVLLVAIALSGCAMSPAERTWQTLHAVDVAQTYNGPASDACYREANPITRELIGEKPSPASVIVWGLAAAGLHALVSDWLEESHPRAARAWQFVSIGEKGLTVANNFRQGVRPFGANDCPWR